ncbi:monocyte chemotactic protein 1B-like [Xiphias gladius]|uniref:monocyte chemotactic protein 1B-like n=1 Tax=Xiphias gladius TaxID=8245 RepID=UPI001A981807|nr:monocyte chemotactic protein 1B-like [Xiphias gladius]
MMSHTFVSLLLLTTMVSLASAQGGIASCCRKISSTQVQRDMLKSYYIQHLSSCPVQAVVFTTLKSKRICSDPDKWWTRTSMAYLDRKNLHLTPAPALTQHPRSGRKTAPLKFK